MADSNDREFWLRRLHSLTGIVPIGVFLLEHMFTNSKALQGKAQYNEAVDWIQHLPYLVWMEIFGIALPILFHAGLGIYIAVRAKHNVTRYGYFRNWMYFFQRVSGIVLVFYIAWHVWVTRIEAIRNPLVKLNFFDHMVHQFKNPLVLVFQFLGVLSAAFHFSNGLWTFLIVWGLVIGRRSQKWASVVCYGLGALIVIFGIDSLRGFLAVGG